MNPASAYRQGNRTSAPLPADVRQELVASQVWEDRARVALQNDLAPDLLSALIHDDNASVRHMLYNLHRDIPLVLLEAALERHPEDAPSISFQTDAPFAALRLKPFNFASPDDIERYLTGSGANEDRSRAFRSIAKTSDNALLTLDALMQSLSR